MATGKFITTVRSQTEQKYYLTCNHNKYNGKYLNLRSEILDVFGDTAEQLLSIPHRNSVTICFKVMKS